MYSDVVLGIEISHFEKHLERAKAKRGVKQDGRFQGVSGIYIDGTESTCRWFEIPFTAYNASFP